MVQAQYCSEWSELRLFDSFVPSWSMIEGTTSIREHGGMLDSGKQHYTKTVLSRMLCPVYEQEQKQKQG